VPGADRPVLWQIGVSHYSEKVRWALAYKGVEHERRSPVPGAHMLFALWLTRGTLKTFPIIQLDGETIGDSTTIIAALEQRYPDPPLYPGDPNARGRALELEEWFDENLGPQIRLLAWHEVTTDPEGGGMDQITERTLPPALRNIGAARAAGAWFGSQLVRLRYRVADEASAASARRSVIAALDRLEAELGDGEYLVGDAFTVADLTAASLFYPLILPPEGPRLPPPPPGFDRFRAPLMDRRGYRWVADMFARHRKPAATPA
jgi:glutathione S-transferase